MHGAWKIMKSFALGTMHIQYSTFTTRNTLSHRNVNGMKNKIQSIKKADEVCRFTVFRDHAVWQFVA